MSLRLLLDEHLSPSLTARLAEIGVFAQAVAHVGLSGQPDRTVWTFALEHEMAVVTTDAADFLVLLDDMELHPGLILLRESGLNRQQQWERLAPAVRFIQSQQDVDYLLNRVMDILAPATFAFCNFRSPEQSHKSSKIPAAPMPPPTHIVTMP